MRMTSTLGGALVALLAAPQAAHAQQRITPTVMPPPPPTTANPRNFGPWPVGQWAPAASSCHASRSILRLHKDRRYEGPTDTGSWTMAAGRIRFTYRVVGPDDTSDTERYAPVRTRSVVAVKLAPDRMTLDGAAWKRCSADPDLFIQ